jgi:hypothetical protein
MNYFVNGKTRLFFVYGIGNMIKYNEINQMPTKSRIARWDALAKVWDMSNCAILYKPGCKRYDQIRFRMYNALYGVGGHDKLA